MTFRGMGIFTMWNDVEPLHKFEFNVMHARNHLLDHLAYLGENAILSGRRYVDGIGTLPPFFMFYDMATLDVLTDEAHQDCRVADSEWFLQLRPHVRDLIRYNWRVVARTGGGVGSSSATFIVRRAASNGSDETTAWQRFAEDVLGNTSCTAAHVAFVDLATPIRVGQAVPSYEPDDARNALIVVEAFDRFLLAEESRQIDRALQTAGLSAGPAKLSHYALSFALDYRDLPKTSRLEALPA